MDNILQSNKLSAKQKDKWKELNDFFQTQSKYYKQIDNKDVVFTIWYGGSGGEFLTCLFHDIGKTQEHNRYDVIDSVISFCSTNDVHGQHNLIDKSYNIYYQLDIPKFDNETDSNFNDCFSDFTKPINNINYFTSHGLPIIPYLYYKNPERIKIIIVDITNVSLMSYISTLGSIKITRDEKFKQDNFKIGKWGHHNTSLREEIVKKDLNSIRKVINPSELLDNLITDTLIDFCTFITFNN